MRGRFRGRVDKTQAGIKAVAESFGWQVVSLASCGDGVPDLLIWRYPQGFRLVECKSGKTARLTAAQDKFKARYSMPVHYIRSEEQAREVFAVITEPRSYDESQRAAKRLTCPGCEKAYFVTHADQRIAWRCGACAK